jgi:CBS domain-containing protein
MPPRWLSQTLGEMHHEPPLCVAPDARVREVIGAMNQARGAAALVLEHGDVRGIFTETDVLTRVVAQPDALDRPVAELMTADPHVLPASTLLSAALRTLALGSYHHLPVVDEAGKPRAVVSLRSIVAFLVEAFPREIMNAPPEQEPYPNTPDGA